MPSSILVTGANGFIGSRLCEALLRRGDRVTAMVRRTSDLSFLKGLDVPLVFADVSRDFSLPPAIRRLDSVIHAAGLASDWGPYEKFHRANVDGTLNVLKLAVKLRVKRVIILSSLSVMGFGHRRGTEESPQTRSQIPYVLSKRRMEEEALAFSARHGLETVILRPGDVYGENDRTTTLKMFAALEAGSMGFISSGRATLSPLFIDNLIQACLLSLTARGAAGGVFNITDGVTITWKDWIRRICLALGVRLPGLNVPFAVGWPLACLLEAVYRLIRSPEPPLLTRYRILHAGKDFDFDIGLAERVLGYRPSRDLDGHLRRTAAWYKTARDRKTRILITGSSGLWGWNLCGRLSALRDPSFEILATWHRNRTSFPRITTRRMDLLNPDSIASVVRGFRPDVIVHAAALSRRDDCEAHKALATRLNVTAVKTLAGLANIFKARLVFFSTDLVYAEPASPGDPDLRLSESAPVGPKQFYGRTKLEAERAIQSLCYDYLILRTALSFGPPPPATPYFLDTAIRTMARGGSVRFFTDQYRTPISTFDGVDAILALLKAGTRNRILNFGGLRKISRYGMGLETAKIFGFRKSLVAGAASLGTGEGRRSTRDAALDVAELRKAYPRLRSLTANLRKLKKSYAGVRLSGD